MGGCLRFLTYLLFGWIDVVATANARSFGREHAVPGPEALDLVHRLEGAIVMGQPRGRIQEIMLPGLEERVVRQAARDDAQWYGVASAVSGPDSLGRIAYVEDSMSIQLRLRVIDATRSHDRVMFTRFARPVEAIHETALGSSLALAPAGAKCALVSHLHSVQMRAPMALLEVGGIEIWDVDSGEGRTTGITALDDGLSWFPDGRHLAYSVLTPKDQVGSRLLEPDGPGNETEPWPQIPAVYILDVETNSTEFFHGGRRPVVSSDGKNVLVTDSQSHWRLIDVGSHQSTPVRAPGQWGAPLALINRRLVIYPGLPTAGAPIRLTESNSPLRGPKLLLTIKVADLETAEFQTLVPYYDPRLPASIGLLLPCPPATG